MSDLAQARQFALSLPEVTEEPHFDMASFRVRGKIFVTVPPEETRLHVFVDPLEVGGYVAQDPAAFEPLRWGERVRGLRVNLAAISPRGPGRGHRGVLAPQSAQAPRRRIRPAANRVSGWPA